MRHLITVAFFAAAYVAYVASANEASAGIAWLAWVLLAAGLLCEFVFWLRVFTSEKAGRQP